MKSLVSPKQVARAVGVSESSLKRWCDQGLLPTVKTAGGHRRLPISGVLDFLRTSGHRLVHPEELGLPTSMGEGRRSGLSNVEELKRALVEGKEGMAGRIVLDLYLAGRTIPELCDRVIAEAFQQIGEGWSCGSVEVYQERRACEICLQILSDLRMAVRPPEETAPIAIGATLSGDHYGLPTRMVELVLRERGWQATSLGCHLPVETVQEAITTLRPRLVWISASHIANTEELLRSLTHLGETARERGAALLLGGRALDPSLLQAEMRPAFCDGMITLAAKADAIWMRPSPAT